jgi:predicted N-acyltransferase
LKRHLGAKVIVYVALEGSDPVGVTVALRAGDALFLSIGGTDVARGRKTRVYFNNSYNKSIEDAIASGVGRIYCGKLLYDLKLRRGFRMMGLSAYVHTPRRLRAALLAPAFAAQRAKVQRMIRADLNGVAP